MRKTVIIALLGIMSVPFSLLAKPVMYVPSGEANDIVIIDLITDKITGRIGEMENAHGLSSNPTSDYLVAGSMEQIVPDEQENAVKPESVSEEEHKVHHAGGEEGSAENINSSFVSIVHPEHGHVMRRIGVRGRTHHTAVSPDGKTAIAVHSGAGGISIINLDTFQVTKILQTGDGPNYAIFSRDGKRLYVSNAQSGTISEVDIDTWVVKREIKVGKRPEHMIIAPDGSKLFVVNVGEGTAAAVNLDSGIVTNSFATGAKPHGIDISDDGRWLFVTSMTDNKLNRIDLSSNKIQKIDLQPAPYHLEYIDEIKKLYVSSRKQPVIWVVDPVTLAVKHTIEIGKGVAHQMVIRDE